jgi:cholesterol transport system auxiliary component
MMPGLGRVVVLAACLAVGACAAAIELARPDPPRL